MKAEEFEAKTVEQAIYKASKHFGVSPDDLEIEVITHGSTGLFGIGAKRAKIRAYLKPERILEKRAQEAVEILNEILKATGLELEIQANLRRNDVLIDICGEDSEFLLLRQGTPLDALEYLVNKIVARRLGVGPKIVLDVQGFRQRQEKRLREMARKAAERVRRTKRPMELKPMPAHERRLVHLFLRSFPGVYTRSRGRGDTRRVIIYPEASQHK